MKKRTLSIILIILISIIAFGITLIIFKVNIDSVIPFLQNIIFIVGIPIGLIQFVIASRKEIRDREYGTYDALDQKYLDFQKFCFDNPNLDIFDIADKQPKVLTPQEEKQEMIAFIMLYKLFERAFLMYRNQSSGIKKKQWIGWQSYIDDYLERTNFQKYLPNMLGQYDIEFDKYIYNRIQEKKFDYTLPEWAKYIENS